MISRLVLDSQFFLDESDYVNRFSDVHIVEMLNAVTSYLLCVDSMSAVIRCTFASVMPNFFS